MRILGIDSSLTATGLARLDLIEIEDDDDPLWAYEVSVATVGAPKPTKDKSKRAMVRRVNALVEQIDAAFDGVEAVAIEGLAYGARGEAAWVLPWVWGRCLELCEKHDVPLTVVATSARAKFAAGKGNANKQAVLLAMERLFPHARLSNDNESDALAVAATLAQALGKPILPLTKYRAEVIDGLGD